MTQELNTEDNIEEIKKKITDENLDLNQIAKSLRISPSKKQILNLPKDLLIKHNALIFHKGSSLSSTQRKMVMERVAYGIKNKSIKTEEVATEINKLNALIQGELIKIHKKDDSSSDI